MMLSEFLISAHEDDSMMLAMKVDMFFSKEKRGSKSSTGLDLTSPQWPERILDLTISIPISHDIAS
jgi:hypothetical protein